MNSKTKSKRPISSHAHVAKLCRAFCKELGVKCRARSEVYSMGSSVRVEIEDEPPQVVRQLNDEFSKYQYGHFNAMEDIYEYSNSRDDVPQVKHFFLENRYSNDMRQRCWDWLRDVRQVSNALDNPADFQEAKGHGYYEPDQQHAPWTETCDYVVSSILSGNDTISIDENGNSFKDSDLFWEYVAAGQG